jgi:hypothetical protein
VNLRNQELMKEEEVRRLSDKELKDKKASEESDSKNNIDDEEDLLDTHPPPERSMNASFIINAAFGKSGTDIYYPAKKEKKDGE